MLVVGLTGGIASGKTTAARIFAGLGVPVIDADEISRELVEPGSPCLEQIAAAFGPEALDAAGRLDRPKMREKIFRDPAAKEALENILHPAIRAEMKRRIARLTTPYCVLVIPLLLETGQNDLVNRVLVVDAPESQQRDRLRDRDGSSAPMIDAILAAQLSRKARLQGADDVIHNDRDLPHLEQQVNALHKHYLVLASPGRS